MSEINLMHDQELVKLGDEEVLIDQELVELIKALNNAGLITRSHCSGHGVQGSWIAIKSDSITGIEVRQEPKFNEVLIKWDPSWLYLDKGGEDDR